MTALRQVRIVMLTVASGALAVAASLWFGVSPAGASSPSGLCTLLPGLCPPTTRPASTPPTSKAAPTTAPPTTHPAPTAAANSRHSAVAQSRNTPAVASVGAAGLPTPALGAVDLPSLGAGTDAVAPQLAGTPAPTNTGVTIAPSASAALSGLVGTTRGLPDHHSGPRIALSIVALMVAAVAAAQLPLSRRLPRSDGDPLT